MLARVPEERAPVGAARADVVDTPRGRSGAAAAYDQTSERRSGTALRGRIVTVSSPTFGDETGLDATCSKGSRALRFVLLRLRDQRFEEREVLALFGMPQDAEGEAAGWVLERFQRSVAARARLREAGAELRRSPDGGATSRRAASPSDRRRAACRPRPRRRAPRTRPASRLCASCPTRPARAARGRRRARRSAPASRGRSRAPACRARARPASAPARSRRARARRRSSPDAPPAPYSSGSRSEPPEKISPSSASSVSSHAAPGGTSSGAPPARSTARTYVAGTSAASSSHAPHAAGVRYVVMPIDRPTHARTTARARST